LLPFNDGSEEHFDEERFNGSEDSFDGLESHCRELLRVERACSTLNW
jgi:hypothetical protein